MTVIFHNDEIQPYSPWITEALQTLAPMKPRALAICAILPDDEVFTGYYKMTVQDQYVIAANVNADALLGVLEANGYKPAEEEEDASNE